MATAATSVITTVAAAAIAAATAVAAVTTVAAIAAVAAMTTVMTVTTVMAAAIAGAVATAVAAAVTSAATTVAAVTGDRLVVAAHQGDADDREEDRDPKHKCTIHPKLLQTNRYPSDLDSNQLLLPPRTTASTHRDGDKRGAFCTGTRRSQPIDLQLTPLMLVLAG